MDATETKYVRLEVRARTERGFRREGRHFGPDPVEASFTEEAAQRLALEPQLIVRRLGGENLSPEQEKVLNLIAAPITQPEPKGFVKSPPEPAPSALPAIAPATVAPFDGDSSPPKRRT